MRIDDRIAALEATVAGEAFHHYELTLEVCLQGTTTRPSVTDTRTGCTVTEPEVVRSYMAWLEARRKAGHLEEIHVIIE